MDEAGNESQMTTLQVMTGEAPDADVTPPTAPEFNGFAGLQFGVLSWDASVDDRGVAGYVILLDGFL